MTFLAVDAVVVVAGVLADRTVYDAHAARYLVLAVLDLAACLALGLAMMPGAPPGVVAAGRGDRGGGARAQPAVSAAVTGRLAPRSWRHRRATSRTCRPRCGWRPAAHPGGPTGPFWTADLQTHLSDGRFQVVEVVCDRGRLRRRLWLTDTARERVRASRAAVIVPAAAAELNGCTADSIAAQLGGSSQRLRMPGGTTVLVVSRDVRSGSSERRH